MTITAVTHSTSLALTTSDANDHLRGLYTENDTHLTRLIEAATDWVESTLGIYLLNATITETFATWDSALQFRPARAPLGTVTSVKYYDSDSTQQTWTSTNYIVTAAKTIRGLIEVAPDISLPAVDARAEPWEVIYVAGYGSAETSVPERIQHALRLLVEDFDRHRGNLIDGRASAEAAVGVRRLLASAELGQA